MAVVDKLKTVLKKAVCWAEGTRAVAWLRTADKWYSSNLFIINIMAVIVYRLVLDAVYIKELSPHYAYSGFETHMLPLTYAASFVALVAFAPFVAQLGEQREASSILLTFLNYLYFIPLTSFWGCYGKASITFFAVSFLYWAALLLWQFRLPRICIRPVSIKHSRGFWLVLSIASSLLVLFVSGRYAHFRLFFEIFDMYSVYGVRAEAAEYSMPRLFSYALSMMTICLSMAMLHWSQQKKKIAVILLAVVYFFYYSIAAHKSVFFFLVLLFGVYWLYRDWMLRYLPVELTAACLLMGTLSRLGMIALMSLFYRRFMYVPVYLSWKYFDFFSERPLNLMRDGLMGKVGYHSIYSLKIVRLIGEFCGTPESNCNNGLIGDMAANLPILLGLLIMPLVLLVVFRLLNAVSGRLDKRIVLPFCIFYAVAFVNGSWSTVLLSHGYLLACILLYLLPREERELDGKNI